MMSGELLAEAATRPEIVFGAGLPGFPGARRFVLEPWGAPDGPFWLMSCREDPDLAFVLVIPWVFFPDYDFELDPTTIARLGVQDPTDVLVYSVVTLGDRPEDATANLLGPIVVNRNTHEAVQAVLARSDYEARTPIARA
ncbi:MAG: flagellar assembly protein FliW [Acidimicrobiia bacterium]|nr:flagellar assembly protein FliW [Acidimicrobiia bacterium]